MGDRYEWLAVGWKQVHDRTCIGHLDNKEQTLNFLLEATG